MLKTDMSSADFWAWWGRTSPPDRREKPCLQQIEAPHLKTGGCKSGRKRKKVQKIYNNPFR